MEDTPSLSDHNDDTPVTRTSLSQKNCNYQSPAFSRSISFQESDMSFNKRMDRLHENLIKVRRMVKHKSLLKKQPKLTVEF